MCATLRASASPLSARAGSAMSRTAPRRALPPAPTPTARERRNPSIQTRLRRSAPTPGTNGRIALARDFARCGTIVCDTRRRRAAPAGCESAEGGRMPEERRLPDFLEALGSGAPTPGGGAASAVAGALAAALAEMVANFTVGRPKYAEVEAGMRAIVARARTMRERLLALAEDDERAYAQVSAAYKRPKATEIGR